MPAANTSTASGPVYSAAPRPAGYRPSPMRPEPIDVSGIVAGTAPKLTRSRGGGGSSGGGGGINYTPVPKPIQQLPGGTFDPNTNTFTDIYGNKSSTTNPSALSAQIVEKKQKEELKAFSKTGGLVTPGLSTTPFFKTSVQDVKTDSLAIKTATKIADEKVKTSISEPTRVYSPFSGAIKSLTGSDIVSDFLGEQRQTVKDKTGRTYVQTKQPNIYFSDETKEYINVETGKKSKDFTRVQTVEDISATSQRVATGLFAGSPVTSAAVKGTVSGVTRAGQFLVSPLSKAIEGSAQLFGRGPVSREAVRFVGSQAASGTGYFLSSQAPEGARQTYDVLNPEQAQKFSQFETKKDLDKIAKAYNEASVKTIGGKEIDAEGKETAIPSTVDPLTGFVYGAIPSTRLTNETFVNAWETRLKAEYADDSRYKALSPQEKKEFIEYKKAKELSAGQIGGFAGQIGTEVSSEIGGSGANRAFFNRLSGGTTGSVARRAGARVVTVLPYGISEGAMQPVTEASSERRIAETNEILFGAIAGAGTSSFFAGAPTLLRGSAREGAEVAGKTVSKTTTKVTKEVAKKSDSTTRRILAGGVELGGYLLDPLEKPGDIAASPIKRGIGISTINLTPGGRTTTATDSKTKTGTQTKQPSQGMSKRGPTYDIATGTYTDAKGNKSSMSLGSVPTNVFVFNSNVNKPGVSIPGPGTPTDTITGAIIDNITDTKTDTDTDADTKEETETEEKTETNVPSFTNVQTTSTTPVIAPQRFFFPGFFPVGSGGTRQARERTKFYDELAAAGKRFEQLSGIRRR